MIGSRCLKVLSREALAVEAVALADLIIHTYSSGEGGIYETVDVADGRVLDSRCAVDELGDYIQYIIYLGILTGKEDYVTWGIRTLQAVARNYQSDKGLFFTCPLPRGGIFKNNLLSLNNADTLTGLVSAYMYTETPSIKALIQRFIEGAFAHFTKDTYLTYGYLLGDRLPVSLSSLLFTGYFIEETLTFMEDTGDHAYLEQVDGVIHRNLRNPYFLKYGLFQARIPIGVPGFFWQCLYRATKGKDLRTTFLVKDNIYFLFALLQYARFKKDSSLDNVITKVYGSFMDTFLVNGILYNTWNPVQGVKGEPSPLALSHSLIELQLDLFHESGDERYLRDAVLSADRWLEGRSSLGVIRETVREDEPYGLLDPNVDFAVNLFKLTEKTGDTGYLEKALEIVSAVMMHFKAPAGYYWKIHTENGTPLQRHIETKYLGLLLKLFLVAMECMDNREIFKNPLIRNLAKDR